MIEIEEIQSKIERDEETLNALGGEFVINGVLFPPPTTAVLSLLEIIDSPFIVGFDSVADIKLKHINEILYILKYRELAVNDLFGLVRFERIAEKSPAFYEKYLKSSFYSDFETRVFKFAESLGVFDQLTIISQIQGYMNLCFNAFEMIPPNSDNKPSGKKKDTTIVNGLQA